jgi:D-tyrosyl-tRNA(Tyr) deacylase
MKVVVQRVTEAHVVVDGVRIGETLAGAPGLLVLVGATHGDTSADADYLATKVCGLRIFEDSAGKMNRSLNDVGGGMLVISQFTLYGDCSKGRRPSFVGAMAPEPAAILVDRFVATARTIVDHVETGRFGADMAVSLVNDGPVTLILERN